MAHIFIVPFCGLYISLELQKTLVGANNKLEVAILLGFNRVKRHPLPLRIIDMED